MGLDIFLSLGMNHTFQAASMVHHVTWLYWQRMLWLWLLNLVVHMYLFYTKAVISLSKYTCRRVDIGTVWMFLFFLDGGLFCFLFFWPDFVVHVVVCVCIYTCVHLLSQYFR